MINQTTLKGNWNEIKGKLRTRWGQLTNDDVQTFNGNVDQLVGLIERKTGETRSAVEDYLNQLTANGSASVGAAVEDARKYVQDAAQRIQDGSRQAMDTFRENYEEAEEMVRQRPTESVAVCFGIGVFVGLLFGLSLRGR
jgi:uncharacterized protein YjbJ (UPF0337 family)